MALLQREARGGVTGGVVPRAVCVRQGRGGAAGAGRAAGGAIVPGAPAARVPAVLPGHVRAPGTTTGRFTPSRAGLDAPPRRTATMRRQRRHCLAALCSMVTGRVAGSSGERQGVPRCACVAGVCDCVLRRRRHARASVDARHAVGAAHPAADGAPGRPAGAPGAELGRRGVVLHTGAARLVPRAQGAGREKEGRSALPPPEEHLLAPEERLARTSSSPEVAREGRLRVCTGLFSVLCPGRERLAWRRGQCSSSAGAQHGVRLPGCAPCTRERAPGADAGVGCLLGAGRAVVPPLLPAGAVRRGGVPRVEHRRPRAAHAGEPSPNPR